MRKILSRKLVHRVENSNLVPECVLQSGKIMRGVRASMESSASLESVEKFGYTIELHRLLDDGFHSLLTSVHGFISPRSSGLQNPVE